MLHDHFNELVLCLVLAGMLGFTAHMSGIHNDSLASKGSDYAGQVLAALLAIMAAKKLTSNNNG